MGDIYIYIYLVFGAEDVMHNEFIKGSSLKTNDCCYTNSCFNTEYMPLYWATYLTFMATKLNPFSAQFDLI